MLLAHPNGLDLLVSQASIAQAMQMALQAHQLGKLAEAETIYRRILRAEPMHLGALEMLGILASETGRMDVSIVLLRRALEIQPDNSELLGNLGIVLRNAGRIAESLACHQQAVNAEPTSAVTRYNLALAYETAGRPEDAIYSYREALWVDPDHVEARNNLGNLLKECGQIEEAIAEFERVIQLRPEHAESRSNLGTAYYGLGRYDDAVAIYQEALRLKPTCMVAQFNLAVLLQDVGRLPEAIWAFRKAICLRPDHLAAYNLLSKALLDIGRVDEAITVSQEAIRLKADNAEAYNELGNAFAAARRTDEAIAAYQKALRLDLSHVGVCNNLGNVYSELMEHDLADKYFRKAVELAPHSAELHSNLVYSLLFHPDRDSEAILKEQVEWDKRHAPSLNGVSRRHENQPDSERRIRVGYVSPDFRDHVIGRNLIPLLREHDGRQVEVFCYSDVLQPDARTAQFRSYAPNWRNIVGWSDEKVAETVRADRIDVLVDLAMHLERNRLLVFARKPAPIQLSFAAYPGGVGSSLIDYRLTDPYLDPPGVGDSDYREKSYRLPSTFWCYDAEAMTGGVDTAPEPGPLPASQSGVVTFGYLGNTRKINEGVLRLWAKVMGRVKDSRLLLLAPEGGFRRKVLALLAASGVAGERVEFAGIRPLQGYLQLYQRVDIGLDSFPYNGHTTSLDALWMGVPVVTLAGETVVGRAGVSHSKNLGSPELIAHCPEEYLEIAVDLANDLPRLSEIRGNLRQRLEASPIGDAKGFARGIEGAYREMWRQWCASRV